MKKKTYSPLISVFLTFVIMIIMYIIFLIINEVYDEFYPEYKLKFDRWYVGYDYNRYKRECYNEMSNRYGEENFEQIKNFDLGLSVLVVYSINIKPFAVQCLNDGKSIVIE